MKNLKNYLKNFLQNTASTSPLEYKQLNAIQDTKITLQLILVVMLLSLIFKGV